MRVVLLLEVKHIGTKRNGICFCSSSNVIIRQAITQNPAKITISLLSTDSIFWWLRWIIPISWKFRKTCTVIAGGVVDGGETHGQKGTEVVSAVVNCNYSPSNPAKITVNHSLKKQTFPLVLFVGLGLFITNFNSFPRTAISFL